MHTSHNRLINNEIPKYSLKLFHVIIPISKYLKIKIHFQPQRYSFFTKITKYCVIDEYFVPLHPKIGYHVDFAGSDIVDKPRVL